MSVPPDWGSPADSLSPASGELQPANARPPIAAVAGSLRYEDENFARANTLRAGHGYRRPKCHIRRKIRDQRNSMLKADFVIPLPAVQVGFHVPRLLSLPGSTRSVENILMYRKIKEDPRAAESKTTTEHDQIRKWAEQHGGKPAVVRGTDDSGTSGILRIDFPGGAGEDELKHIEWDDWFERFDKENLAYLYQEEKADGSHSTFFKLVSR